MVPQDWIDRALESINHQVSEETMRKALEAVFCWAPIRTAPKDGTEILLGVAGEEFNAKSARWSDRVGNWVVHDDGRRAIQINSVVVTHWMPLPEPPKDTP